MYKYWKKQVRKWAESEVKCKNNNCTAKEKITK